MTIAGILDIALGAMGLSAAILMVFAITFVAWIVAVAQWLRFFMEGHFLAVPDFAEYTGAILGLVALALISVLADACLFATGIQLLARSRNARRSAILFAVLIIPLGAVDVLISGHAGFARPLLLAFVLPLPIYSLLQLAAFFGLRSWRSLNRRDPSAATACAGFSNS